MTDREQIAPVAWLHTLHMEGGQTYERISRSPENAHGIPGRDYSEEYEVTSTPIYIHPPAQPSAMDRLIADDADLIDMTDREQIAPVAFMYSDSTGIRSYRDPHIRMKDTAGWTETPLYTAEQMAAARIEGARAMQDAAANVAPSKTPSGECETVGQWTRRTLREAIRALDPEAIMKECFDD